MDKYLKETKLLDFNSKEIKSLIKDRGWMNLDEYKMIESTYNFVRDEILFGYNKDDKLNASLILKDGYGQCNTKGILFMALLRALNIPCRFHGFAIDKELQKGAITGFWYKVAPGKIVHSWVEIFYKGKWINIEGFILDLDYLKSLQNIHENVDGSFSGFGVATDNFKNPDIHWNGNDTYIQKEGIVEDFGIYDDPDSFFDKNSQNIGFIKKLVYKILVRHLMNRNVSCIRFSKNS